MTQRIVLTGGIASGKSTVADLLAERGAVLVDADLLAREVVAPGTDGLAAVVDRFGAGVLRPDGTLDRAGLGALVFADAAALADLNAIVHPRVRALAEASRYVEARGRAQSFRSRWPKSVLLPAVEAAVAAAPEDGATGR